MINGEINVLNEECQGFVLSGVLYDDIPYMTPEENKAALIASSKLDKRKEASLKYHVNEIDRNRAKNKNQQGEEGGGDNYNGDYDNELNGNHDLSSRERAAIERRVAEREANIANEKYKQVLIEHSKIKQRELLRIAEKNENKNRLNKIGGLNNTKIISSLKSKSTRKKTDVIIINNSEKTVKVFWIDYRGQEIEYYTLSRDESKKVLNYKKKTHIQNRQHKKRIKQVRERDTY